ncbi:polysaccharide pyruvyl transferase family protein [Plantibacter sp. CFBP 13570]|uniref:polysaccharide pyruvyl transferase family protein n=1 Tax=Plantibacter sp. CFBP 13570 TaxID=2775272 RepID=UPI0019309BB8|nr:polysaccharide pyruvyl transferase family protein [Plantibacter sp. CFBP 13570]MBD8535936.1 polysaccharide pyruvyl transferase family protein [Plantibacter sp. CFBP 13570]
MLQLAGGWGYNNLGDEAILAGYLEELAARRVDRVLSVDPARTRSAQVDSGIDYVSERRTESRARTADLTVLAGGGFLNGNWRREIGGKLRRLIAARGNAPLVVHGVEVRRLAGGRYSELAKRLLRDAIVAVRDDKSATELERLGLPRPDVQPDGISFLYPRLAKYRTELPELRGKVLLNLLDINSRNDAHEAEVDISRWADFCRELIEHLDGRAVGLVIGGGDYRFMKTLPPMELVTPHSVGDLVSTIGSADAILSVRMHPALLGTALGIPTVSVPYCGKVRPSLEQIGVSDVLMEDADTEDVLRRLSKPTDFSNAWQAAYESNSLWMDRSMNNAVRVKTI